MCNTYTVDLLYISHVGTQFSMKLGFPCGLPAVAVEGKTKGNPAKSVNKINHLSRISVFKVKLLYVVKLMNYLVL